MKFIWLRGKVVKIYVAPASIIAVIELIRIFL